MRLYYQVDGAKLPSGDVLAAIFASLAPATNAPAAQAVRVGTLLVLQHGAAPPRTVRVEALKAPFFQTGQQLVADFALKNTAAPSNAYFPLVTVATWPYGTKQIDGPLIAAGNSRAVRFVKPGNYIGPILMTVNAEGHEQRVLLFAATGFWQWLAPLLCALVVGVIAALFKKRHHRAKH